MKCPIDGTTLVMAERHGVEIDYCPECRGVWLDRGELDKIIERDGDQTVRAETTTDPTDGAGGTSSVQTTVTVKRTSLLGEIFRFD